MPAKGFPVTPLFRHAFISYSKMGPLSPSMTSTRTSPDTRIDVMINTVVVVVATPPATSCNRTSSSTVSGKLWTTQSWAVARFSVFALEWLTSNTTNSAFTIGGGAGGGAGGATTICDSASTMVGLVHCVLVWLFTSVRVSTAATRAASCARTRSQTSRSATRTVMSVTSSLISPPPDG